MGSLFCSLLFFFLFFLFFLLLFFLLLLFLLERFLFILLLLLFCGPRDSGEVLVDVGVLSHGSQFRDIEGVSVLDDAGMSLFFVFLDRVVLVVHHRLPSLSAHNPVEARMKFPLVVEPEDKSESSNEDGGTDSHHDGDDRQGIILGRINLGLLGWINCLAFSSLSLGISHVFRVYIRVIVRDLFTGGGGGFHGSSCSGGGCGSGCCSGSGHFHIHLHATSNLSSIISGLSTPVFFDFAGPLSRVLSSSVCYYNPALGAFVNTLKLRSSRKTVAFQCSDVAEAVFVLEITNFSIVLERTPLVPSVYLTHEIDSFSLL